MKIFDENGNQLESPDLVKGYLKPDRLFVRHHAAVEAVEDIWHWEPTAEYPGGGRDVEKVVDIPGIPAKEAWDEYEDIQRYIEYTTEDLASNARSKRTSLLKECEWTQFLDAPIDLKTRDAYRIYRQALRDVPQQPGFPEEISWPAAPEIVKAVPDPIEIAFAKLVKQYFEKM